MLSALVSVAFVAAVSAQSTTASSASSSVSSSTSTATGTTHTVMVGQGGLKYVPDSLTAAVGDKVAFTFVSTDHTVAQGSFSNPCQPVNGTAYFNSAFPQQKGDTFTITINSTDPIYYYCAETRHCQLGMVGAINAPSSQSASDYGAASMKTSSSGSPQNVQGGTFSSGNSTANSTMSSSSGAPSGTAPSSSSSPTPSNAASSLKFELGSLAAVLAVPALLLA